MYIEGDNYSAIYHDMIDEIYHSPDFYLYDGYKETINVSFLLTNIMNYNIHNKNREPNYKYAKEFFNHIMSGKTNIDKLAKINPTVKRFTNTTGLPLNFTSQYGPRIKTQLPRVIKLLKQDSETRRAVINILDKDDKIIWDIKTTHEYPCTSLIQFFIRENTLHTLIQMRSNNIITTICYDVYIFINLMKYVHKKLLSNYQKLDLGSYNHQISSAHILSKDNELAESILEGRK